MHLKCFAWSLCATAGVALLLLSSQPSIVVAAEPAAVTPLEQLADSLANWNKLKEKSGGNYRYQVRRASFVGASETEVAVENGKVVMRRYRTFTPPAPVDPSNPNAAAQPDYAWTEEGDKLGTHKEGAPAKTIDELYAVAQEVLTKKLEPHERLYVKYDDRGLLSYCFYVDTRIADDAPSTGVFLTKIELSEAK